MYQQEKIDDELIILPFFKACKLPIESYRKTPMVTKR